MACGAPPNNIPDGEAKRDLCQTPANNIHTPDAYPMHNTLGTHCRQILLTRCHIIRNYKYKKKITKKKLSNSVFMLGSTSCGPSSSSSFRNPPKPCTGLWSCWTSSKSSWKETALCWWGRLSKVEQLSRLVHILLVTIFGHFRLPFEWRPQWFKNETVVRLGHTVASHMGQERTTSEK